MNISKARGEVKVCTGNLAGAYAVQRCRPDVVAIYPITPQTALVEELCKLQADGQLDAEIVRPEGENSAMSIVTAAAACGGRVFTSTSSMGLAFMYDSLFSTSGMRVPVVMAVATREMPFLSQVANSLQDVMSVRDIGFVHIQAENCQEILDSIIVAYKIAEDPKILLGVMVGYEGFFLSYAAEPVEIPRQEDVDKFLEPIPGLRERLVPGVPMNWRGLCLDGKHAEYQYKHCRALDRVKTKIEDVNTEFRSIFGREYGGLIEEYRTEDAEIIMVGIGSYVGIMRVAVDKKREEGVKVGLIKVRFFRPFPREKLAQALKGKKAIGVIDRSVCFGWSCGHLFMETKPVISDLPAPVPMVNFIGGLSNGDISLKEVEKAIDITHEVAQGKPREEVYWMQLEQWR